MVTAVELILPLVIDVTDRVEYEHLPGVVGDETWRKTAVASTVHLSEDGRGGRRCHVRAPGDLFWSACAEDELAMRPPPQGPLLKILLSFPLPIVPGVELDLLPCMD